MFDYKKLRLKIMEVYDTQEAFAKALGINGVALSQRLTNKRSWKAVDIVKACNLLSIPLSDVHLYFFAPKL